MHIWRTRFELFAVCNQQTIIQGMILFRWTNCSNISSCPYNRLYQSIWKNWMRACMRARALVCSIWNACTQINQINKQMNGVRRIPEHGQRRNIQNHFSVFVEFHIRTENQHLPFGFLRKSQWIYFIVFCRECVHMRAIKTATPLFKCNKRKSICLSVRFRRHINTCMFGRAK